MDFLFRQQIAKLNCVMGISLAEKFRGSRDTKCAFDHRDSPSSL